jgi:hypothetical protein
MEQQASVSPKGRGCMLDAGRNVSSDCSRPGSGYCGKQLAEGVFVLAETLVSRNPFGGPALSAVWLRSISAPLPSYPPSSAGSWRHPPLNVCNTTQAA